MPNYPGGLDDQLKDVPADSSTDDVYDDDNVEPEVEELDAADVDADKQDDGDEDGDGDDKSGRDINNVYREFARKQEDFQERMQKQHNNDMRELIATLRDRPAQPAQQDGGSLDSTSIDQLKNMRSNVPEDKREAFDDYLQERVIKAETDKRMGEFSKNQDFDFRRKEANRSAVERYPELRDNNSDFYLRVDEALRARGTDYVNTNPNAVSDVANAIAVDMGVTAKAKSGLRRRTAIAPANRQNARPVVQDTKDTISDEKIADLKATYEGNIPGLKIDTKNIKASHKLYSDNRDLFTK